MCVQVIMLQPKFRYYASIKNWIMLLQIQKFETNTTLLEIGENYTTLRYHGVTYSDDKCNGLIHRCLKFATQD